MKYKIERIDNGKPTGLYMTGLISGNEVIFWSGTSTCTMYAAEADYHVGLIASGGYYECRKVPVNQPSSKGATE